MSSLRNTISELASHFATNVLGAIRGASLEEILAETGGVARRGPGRPAVAAKAASSAETASSSGAGKGARRKRGGRLGRRSAGDIAGIVDQIVALLEANPKGLRAEEIRKKLDLEAKELPRPIAEALSGKRITKQGQKRATTYFSGGGGGGGIRRAGRPAKEAAAKKGAAKKAGKNAKNVKNAKNAKNAKQKSKAPASKAAAKKSPAAPGTGTSAGGEAAS